MATPCIECTGGVILDGLLVQNVANIQSVNAFIGEFDIQKRAVPCFCSFTDPDSMRTCMPTLSLPFYQKSLWDRSNSIVSLILNLMTHVLVV